MEIRVRKRQRLEPCERIEVEDEDEIEGEVRRCTLMSDKILLSGATAVAPDQISYESD